MNLCTKSPSLTLILRCYDPLTSALAFLHSRGFFILLLSINHISSCIRQKSPTRLWWGFSTGPLGSTKLCPTDLLFHYHLRQHRGDAHSQLTTTPIFQISCPTPERMSPPTVCRSLGQPVASKLFALNASTFKDRSVLCFNENPNLFHAESNQSWIRASRE